MSRKVFSTILIVFMALILLSGCNSSAKAQDDAFDPAFFVNECKVLVPAKQYQNVTLEEFEACFTKAVLDEFGKSDYYKNMTDAERVAALYEIADILKEYEYGNVKNGFIDSFEVDINRREVTWHNKDAEHSTLWSIPR